MRDRRVAMEMRVRFALIPGEVVLVAMVLVVRVRVRVLHRLVRVAVLVALGEVQPHTGAHQRRGQPEG